MSIDDPNASGESQNTSVSQLQNRATEDLNDITAKAKGDLDAVTQRAAEDARQLGEQAKAKVGEATEQAKSFASDQKSLAASQINGVADALTKVAGELDSSDQRTIARYARDMAQGLSGVGKTIEDRDVDDLMGMAQDFGRKQPVAFLGAAALAGFVASRFALASTHRRDKAATGTSTNTSTSTTAPSGTTSTAQSDYSYRTGGL